MLAASAANAMLHEWAILLAIRGLLRLPRGLTIRGLFRPFRQLWLWLWLRGLRLLWRWLREAEAHLCSHEAHRIQRAPQPKEGK